MIIAEPRDVITAPGMVVRTVGVRSNAAVVVSVTVVVSVGGVPKRRAVRLHERPVSRGVRWTAGRSTVNTSGYFERS